MPFQYSFKVVTSQNIFWDVFFIKYFSGHYFTSVTAGNLYVPSRTSLPGK